MKRTLFILTCIFLATATPAVAQKNRAKKTNSKNIIVPTINISEAISQYRFEEAIKALNEQIQALEDQGQNTEEAELQLQQAEQGQRWLLSTEQITFIDSIIVPKDELLKYIYLSDEVGTITTYPEFFGDKTNTEASVFLSQMKDKIFYADKEANGKLKLFSRDRIGTEWGEPSALKGISDKTYTYQNYPYMLADGYTLYFAAKGENCIGGYDIFQTRYDVDERTFLSPENIGMPFNSPANDYLYIEDDFANIGYFATDRNQENGKVCIYTFIPNESRKIYNNASITPERLRSLAMLKSIKDTWTNAAAVEEARTRVAKLKQATTTNHQNSLVPPFIINDNRIVHETKDLKDAEARKQYSWWVESQKQLEQTKSTLEQLRQQYVNANVAGKQNLRPQIIEQEENLRKLKASIHEQEKQIRKLENN